MELSVDDQAKSFLPKCTKLQANEDKILSLHIWPATYQTRAKIQKFLGGNKPHNGEKLILSTVYPPGQS